MTRRRYVLLLVMPAVIVIGLLVMAGGGQWRTALLSASLPAAASEVPTTAVAATGPSQMIVGLAVLGDSTQDEYQAESARGGAYRATTLNWVEQLATLRGINVGMWGSRAEPRRSGYAYNWARSGATVQQLLASGQHTGAAQQARDGEVSHALIQVGINDFTVDRLALRIYDGSLTGPALAVQLDVIAESIMLAARTLAGTGRCQVLVVAVQDYVSLPIVPEVPTTLSDPIGRQRLIDAFASLNQRLRALSAQDGLPFFDFNAAYLAELQRRHDGDGWLNVGGVRISLRARGNAPTFGLLDDEYVHPGTVLSGLYANVYVAALNQHFQTEIIPLHDDEILRTAGLAPAPHGQR